MSNSIKSITLPSVNTNLYGDDSVYRKPIQIRMISVADESELFSSTSEESINRLIKRCVVEPKNFDVNELIPEDRLYILIQLRIWSYTDKYNFPVSCVCGYSGNLEKNLSDIIVSTPETEYPIKIELPGGDTILYRPLTVGVISQIQKQCKRQAKMGGGSPRKYEIIETLIRSIVGINGEQADYKTAYDYVMGMSGKDRAVIDKVIEQNQIGYGNTFDDTCPNCGADVEINFTLTSEFFRPRDI